MAAAGGPAKKVCSVCHHVFGPGVPIVKAIDQMFHKECLKCKDCGTSVFGKEFVECDHKPQCVPCAEKKEEALLTPPDCKGCKRKVGQTFVKAFGFSFHPMCLVCSVCKKPLRNDGFYDDLTDRILHLDCLVK